MNSTNSHDQQPTPEFGPTITGDAPFDVISWYPAYQSCQRYFINHAQHYGMVQCVSAFINIRLPYQWKVPLLNISAPPSNASPLSNAASPGNTPPSAYFPSVSHPNRQPSAATPQPSLPYISLLPWIRRLIVTGFDSEAILLGFFGNDWERGVGPLQEIERRNYLFAAKSVGWAKVKGQYDMTPEETVPFMKPLQHVLLPEIEKSEKAWSEWLAMEDWMVGPRAPPGDRPMTAASEYRGHHRDHHRDEMVEES